MVHMFTSRAQLEEQAASETEIKDASKLRPHLIYEVIRRDGVEELERSTPTLIWSGIAAGVLMSFSVLGKAVLAQHLPEGSFRPVVENLGYSLGFLIVILGRMQLFTENTITTVLPFLARPCWRHLRAVGRLWGLVLAANLIGAFVAAAFFAFGNPLTPETRQAMIDVSLHAVELPAMDAFLRGIPAGVLIAALVWIMPQVRANSVPVIIIMTWLIAMGGFTHCIAGAVELALAVFRGHVGLIEGFTNFWLPVLTGNILGGTAVFTAMAWGQVHEEVS